MLFNPTDKTNSIVADIDFWLFGTSSVFNDEYSLVDRARNVNRVWDEAITEIYNADANWEWDDSQNSDFPIATTDLTANIDHVTLADSMLVIHRVRVKDRNGTLRTLEPIKRSEATDSHLSSTGSPDRYYKLGNAVFILPVPDYGATDGVEIEFQRGANYFASTDTDSSPGFNPQFHEFLSIGAAHKYAVANSMVEKANYLSNEKEQVRRRMIEFYQKRSPDEKPRLTLKRPSIKRYGL